ncbi:hypothetical protein ZIOFF_030194 [Zingiber officinale]|uniref:RRM domain-containing protein n=1 Tax=Zingiber officinale TaxID=94328 RepID=A0A8J5H909_ZINOF|nr:hypothetical protein ZIOFF_030194 [Zingiber officinale]
MQPSIASHQLLTSELVFQRSCFSDAPQEQGAMSTGSTAGLLPLLLVFPPLLHAPVVQQTTFLQRHCRQSPMTEDRGSVSSLDDEYSLRKDARYSVDQRESLLRRDSRAHSPSPEKTHEKNKRDDSTEPSAVLWIGFPVFLNVEENDLRRAFSPFGEIISISTFRGRSYAFVRYRSIVAACRAKEALHGKLFNNPRVHICFAKSDSTDSERNLSNAPLSQRLKSNSLSGLSSVEPSKRSRDYDSHIGDFLTSPRDAKFLRANDTKFIGLGKNLIRPDAVPGSNLGSNNERIWFHDFSSERKMPGELCGHYRRSPTAERAGWWRDASFEPRQRSPLPDDSLGMEDGSFRSAKKAKVDLFSDGELPEYPYSFQSNKKEKVHPFSDRELPEYPFSDLDQRKHDFGRTKFLPSLPYDSALNKDYESVPFDHNYLTPQTLKNMNGPFADRDDSRSLFDHLNTGPGAFPFDSANLQKPIPEHHQPPRILDWKWEGTISKGGTPVCRVRCFPVGKVLDFILPEFLNCTARTSLDMLANHYYQATSSWVVFFVPETDADITFYNEFMHYLGEKQRAAVAKLEEKVTLFLVPPSEFSQQVLKVPGKVSISGVILKFQHNFSSLQPLEVTEAKQLPFANRRSPDLRTFSKSQNYSNPSMAPLPPPLPYSPPQKLSDHLPYSGSIQPMEKLPNYHEASRHDRWWSLNPATSPNRSSQLHIPNSDGGSFTASAALHIARSATADPHLGNNKISQGSPSSNYAPETSSVPLHNSKFPTQVGTKLQVSSNVPLPLEPQQLTELAALLGQYKQLGQVPSISTDGQNKLTKLLQIDNSHSITPVMHSQASDPHSLNSVAPMYSAFPSSSLGAQVNQVPQNHQPQSNVSSVQTVTNSGHQNEQEETEADPQKRLQATLQLAAALLQQIQQQSKSTDQPLKHTDMFKSPEASGLLSSNAVLEAMGGHTSWYHVAEARGTETGGADALLCREDWLARLILKDWWVRCSALPGRLAGWAHPGRLAGRMLYSARKTR